MARRRRLKPDCARSVFHVFTRTARQVYFWDRDFTKEWLYKHIVRLSRIFYVDLHSVTLLDNHYHIVLSVFKPEPTEPDVKARFEDYQRGCRNPKKWYPWLFGEWSRRLTDLSSFMQEINRTSACYINGIDGKKGHVWGSRYGSVLIESGSMLLKTMAYVELNPVRAGLVTKPSEYRFCSVGRHVASGVEASGVTFPDLSTFAFLKEKPKQHLAFCKLVDYLAEKEAGQEVEFPSDQQEIEQLVMDSSRSMVELIRKKAHFMVHSVLLGSESFCAEYIEKFNLQAALYGEIKPFPLKEGIFNTHLRAGPD